MTRTKLTRYILGPLALAVVLTSCAQPGTAAPLIAAPRVPAYQAAGTSGDDVPQTGPPAAPAVPLPSLSAADTALQAAMPGLFGAADLHPTITGGVISVWSQQGCPYLAGVLNAGQWTVALVHQPSIKGQRTWVGVLRKGGAAALLSLHGGDDGCSGRIVPDEAVTVTASGPITAHGRARFLSFYCLADWDADSDSTTPAQEALMGLYTSGKDHIFVTGELPTTMGTHHVTAADMAAAGGDDDDGQPGLAVLLMPAGADPIAHLITSFGPLLYPLDLSQTGADADADTTAEQILGSAAAYGPGPSAAETITITSVSPLSGTLAATGLSRQDKKSNVTLSFSAPFRCQL